MPEDLINHGIIMKLKYQGASSVYPSLEISAEKEGVTIPCNIPISGIKNPVIKFYDYNKDGKNDIIYQGDEGIIVIEFKENEIWSESRFKEIKYDVKSG